MQDFLNSGIITFYETFLFFMQFARSAFVSQFQESRIRALRSFFRQKGHRPPKSEGARTPTATETPVESSYEE